MVDFLSSSGQVYALTIVTIERDYMPEPPTVLELHRATAETGALSTRSSVAPASRTKTKEAGLQYGHLPEWRFRVSYVVR